jgi:phosphopantothenoylcysteine decarboxylase / phosphopantothenate---cysteine ligase
MRVLITAGPTQEPIDPVRYLGNRSSGQMGKSLIEATRFRGHQVTAILGPVTIEMPQDIRRIDVQTSRQMHDAVLAEFPQHDLLLMAAAVADYRPRQIYQGKIGRSGSFTIELEATEDIIAAAGAMKQPDQRTIGFTLVSRGKLGTSLDKLRRKKLDLIVFNPLETMSSTEIEAILFWPDGHSEELPSRSKRQFADILLQRAIALFP